MEGKIRHATHWDRGACYPHHTHNTLEYRASNHPHPPIVCPSNDSQNAIGQTALFMAIQADGYDSDGAAECVALLRAAGAEAAEEGRLRY